MIKVTSNKESEESMNVSICNLNGKVVYKATTHQNIFDIDLTGETPGIYFVKVDIGGASKVIKVVKN
jgi:hypothetical protein